MEEDTGHSGSCRIRLIGRKLIFFSSCFFGSYHFFLNRQETIFSFESTGCITDEFPMKDGEVSTSFENQISVSLPQPR